MPFLTFAYVNIFTLEHMRQIGYDRTVKKSKAPELKDLFAALADQTRLRLLNLMNGREVCVCYFVEILKQPQSKISRHLAYMRSAGIVSARREGKWMHYRIAKPNDKARLAILNAALAAMSGRSEMRNDTNALSKACCAPQLFRLDGVPVPCESPA
jgi:ArsR family transcriptional regulator, arsenate/arsenite/antimonite-responsive transcriptional repressor